MNRNEAIVPSLHHRKEGWLCHQKYCEATEADTAGVVFLIVLIGKPPRPRCKRMLRAVFLIAQPSPPCGDARRGLSPDSDLFTASMTAAVLLRSATPSPCFLEESE